MKINNKKGAVFIYLIVIGFVIALAFYFIWTSPYKLNRTSYIGEVQLQVMQAGIDVEEMLFYLDNSAGYAAFNAVKDLAENGFQEESKCGYYEGNKQEYYGYTIVKDTSNYDENYCNPDANQVLKDFLSFFSYNLDYFLRNYQQFISSNYKLSLTQDNNLKITGIASNKEELEVLTEGSFSFDRTFSEDPSKDYETYAGQATTDALSKHIYDTAVTFLGSDTDRNGDKSLVCARFVTNVLKKAGVKIGTIDGVPLLQQEILKKSIGDRIYYKDKDGVMTEEEAKEMIKPGYVGVFWTGGDRRDLSRSGYHVVILSGYDEKSGRILYIHDPGVSSLVTKGSNVKKSLVAVYVMKLTIDGNTLSSPIIPTGQIISDLSEKKNEITGMFGTEIVGPSFTGRYFFNPNFKTSINYNLIDSYKDYKSKADTAETTVKTCLAAGSYEDDVNDLDTCYTKYGQSVVAGAEDQEGKFYLFFNIVDNSLIKPFTVKFAYLLKDTIAPPLVKNLEIKQEGNAIVLRWEKNLASDTAIYNVYYSENNFDRTSESTFLGTVPVSENLGTTITQKGYYAVTAVDEAENEIKNGLTVIRYE